MASHVASLVLEMNDTLGDIRQTIDALSTKAHASRLDQLENQRDSTIAALRANFERETDDISLKRRRERDDIAERRRQEDDEIAARRLREDEDVRAKEEREDEEREQRFVGETDDIEDEMDDLMEGVETEAETSLAEGQKRLAQLEERRKVRQWPPSDSYQETDNVQELNHLLDEQVRAPLPTITTRRRSRNQRTTDAAITSKPARAEGAGEPISNTLKAIKEDYENGVSVAQLSQQAGRGAVVAQGEENEQGGSGSENASRGSFESSGLKRSRTASVSSTQRGSRMSALGWIAGKIGLGETREPEEVAQKPAHDSKTEPDRAGLVVTEVADHLHGGGIAPKEASIVQEGPALEKPTPGEKATYLTANDLTAKESNHTHLISNTEAHSSEPESDAALPTLAEAHESNGDDGGEESQLSIVTDHGNWQASSEGQGDPEQSQLLPEYAAPAPQDLDNAQDEPKSRLNHYHTPDILGNEGASEEDVPQERSTVSSPAESHICTTTAPAGSETTLDLDSEPYYEQQSVQDYDKANGKASDKASDSGFKIESKNVDDIPDEGSFVDDHISRSSQPDHAVLSPTEPVGYIDTGETWETPVDATLGEGSLPTWQPVKQEDTVPFSDDNGVEYDEEPTSVKNPSGTLEEGLPHEETHNVSSEPFVSKQNGGEEISGASFYEEVHQTDEGPQSPSPSTVEAYEDSPDLGAGHPFENTGPREGGNVLDDSGEDLELELPPGAMEYSSVAQSVQLPDGTWYAGVVDEEHYESLVARYMIPSVIPRELNLPDDAPSSSPVTEAEDGRAPSLDEHPESMATHSGEQSSDHEPGGVIFARFAHGIQPTTSQLANGVWVVNPSDGEFDDALALSREPGFSTPTKLRLPGENVLKNHELHYAKLVDPRGMILNSQPVTMQLASGAWVLDPSEEEYDSAVTHLRSTSEPPEHGPAMIENPVSPESNTQHDKIYEEFESTALEGAGETLPDMRSTQTLQDRRAFTKEETSSAKDWEVSDREEVFSHQEQAISTPGLPGSTDKRSFSSQAVSPDGKSPPWSPFSSRMPLSPDTSADIAIQSQQLDEAQAVERAANVDTASTAERHLTFGYEMEPGGGEEGRHLHHDTANNTPPHTEIINVIEATTDTESQNFETPRQSAGMESPPPFQNTPDTFDNAVDYPHSDVTREEGATTVHGQDELFDSDSASEYEPGPSVDGNGDLPTNLGIAPPNHALAHGEEAVGTPTTAILQPASERSLHHTSEMPPALEDNSDISPLSLREATPPEPSRGLVFSRHNPTRPVTPPSQTIPGDLGSHGGLWDGSGPVDSTPMSLVSHSTLSSSPGSPVRERIPEGREPAIQNGWTEDIHGLGGEGHGDHDFESGYENAPPQVAKLDENIPTPIATHMPDIPQGNSPATPSPSAFIQRMRGVFENPSDASPIHSRPSSGIFNPSQGAESPGHDVPDEPSMGEPLDEVDDEINERSALLGSVGRN